MRWSRDSFPTPVALTQANQRWACCILCGKPCGPTAYGSARVKGLYCASACVMTAESYRPDLAVPTFYRLGMS